MASVPRASTADPAIAFSRGVAKAPLLFPDDVLLDSERKELFLAPAAAAAEASGIPLQLSPARAGRKLWQKLVPSSTATANIVGDVATLFVVTGLATLASNQSWPTAATLLALEVTLAAVWMLAGAILQHFSPSAYRRGVPEDVGVTSLLVLAVSFCLALASLVHPQRSALPPIPHFMVLAWPATVLMRLLVFRAMARREGPRDDVLVVGSGSLGHCTVEELNADGCHRVAGCLPLEDGAASGETTGNAAALEHMLRTTPVDEVYIAGDLARQAVPMGAAIAVCERLGVPFALPACGFKLKRARPLAGQAVCDGFLHYHPVEPKPYQMALKRTLDIVLSALALVVLAPSFALLAILIKGTSAGPVFFHQMRAGLYGKPFKMLKFRSMVANAEELKDGLEGRNERPRPAFKIRDDPRVTRIGQLIRAYSIDELPQLINVLRGEMSIVGPRPPIPDEVAKYEGWQRRRLSMRPGLTCFWQVSPDRNRISFEQWMNLDMQYIDHWSLKEDLSLICKTLPVVLKGSGMG